MFPWVRNILAAATLSSSGSRVSVLRTRLRFALMASIIAVYALVGFASWNAWSVENQIAERRIESVIAAEERLSRLIFGSLERLLSGVIADRRVADVGVLSALIEALAASDVLEVRTLLVTDSKGVIVNDTRAGKPGVGIDVSDRPYFAKHRDGLVPRDQTYFNEIVESRADGHLSFPMSRALRDENGGFAGVVVTSYGVDALNEAFRELLEDRKDLVALLMTLEGQIIAFPTLPSVVGQYLNDDRILGSAQQTTEGMQYGHSPIDGRNWTVRWKRLDPFPLVIAVGVDRASMFQNTAVRASGWLAFAVIATLILGIGGVALLRMARQADEIRERAEQARLQAESSDRLKTEFLAQLSHEIRTPLNAIVGFSEAIALDVLNLGIDSRYQTYASHVNGASKILLGHVNDLLNMSDVIRGVVRLDTDTVSLNGLLTESVRLMTNQAAHRDIAMEVDTVPDEIHVDVDRRRIIQIVTNLISNAIKYSPEGSTVTVTCSVGADGVTIGVLDRGPGLPPDRVTEAMEPFARLSNPQVSTAGGIGLGLPIAAGLARSHGGELQIGLRPGGGTEALLRLPSDRVATMEPTEHAPT